MRQAVGHFELNSLSFASLRLGLRLFLVFLPFFIRQPLTFDDLTFAHFGRILE